MKKASFIFRVLSASMIAWICSVSIFTPAEANQGVTITVATAANVKPVMEEVKIVLAKRDISVQIVLGSSGKLTAQILQGAPFDVFVSADTKYPSELHEKGLAEKPRVYGAGALVLWTINKENNPSADLSALGSTSIKKIAIANPNVAPYGIATVEAMKNTGIYDEIKEKLVFGESIAQVNQYIDSQAVDIGFTSKSTVLSPEAIGRGKWVEVKTGSYQPIDQALAILDHGKKFNAEGSKEFVKFFFSDEGRAILRKYGYILPQ